VPYIWEVVYSRSRRDLHWVPESVVIFQADAGEGGEEEPPPEGRGARRLSSSEGLDIDETSSRSSSTDGPRVSRANTGRSSAPQIAVTMQV
jgi:hypothetical protein